MGDIFNIEIDHLCHLCLLANICFEGKIRDCECRWIHTLVWILIGKKLYFSENMIFNLLNLFFLFKYQLTRIITGFWLMMNREGLFSLVQRTKVCFCLRNWNNSPVTMICLDFLENTRTISIHVELCIYRWLLSSTLGMEQERIQDDCWINACFFENYCIWLKCFYHA